MMSSALFSQNALLRALPDGVVSPLESVELLWLETRHGVYESDGPMNVVHFPVDAVISVVTTLADGTNVEVGTIGSEGTTGIFAALGANSVPNATFCQVEGHSFVMSRPLFDRLVKIDAFKLAIDAYIVGYLNVLAQLVACNGVHSLDARCARWLLMTHDRVGRNRFPLTQEFLAQMLGVRRSGVTLAASGFAEAGFIKYSRGTIEILDRRGLEHEACECYGVTRREFKFPRADRLEVTP